MRTTARALVAAALTAGTIVALDATASAHVHGFTPLGCLTTDDANAGAVVGFEQAADQAAPLNGPTPLIPLNASGKAPTGGQGADHACG